MDMSLVCVAHVCGIFHSRKTGGNPGRIQDFVYTFQLFYFHSLYMQVATNLVLVEFGLVGRAPPLSRTELVGPPSSRPVHGWHNDDGTTLTPRR